MNNKYAFAALRDKRADIAGQIKALRKQIGRHQSDLAKLDAVIRLFDPAYDAVTIKPKGVSQRPNRFKRGELGQLILDALKKAAAPMPIADIVAYVATALGQGQASAAHPMLARTVRTNLGYLERQHRTVVRIGKRASATWRLTGEPAKETEQK